VHRKPLTSQGPVLRNKQNLTCYPTPITQHVTKTFLQQARSRGYSISCFWFNILWRVSALAMYRFELYDQLKEQVMIGHDLVQPYFTQLRLFLLQKWGAPGSLGNCIDKWTYYNFRTYKMAETSYVSHVSSLEWKTKL
jgi:hypothetical protein